MRKSAAGWAAGCTGCTANQQARAGTDRGAGCRSDSGCHRSAAERGVIRGRRRRRITDALRVSLKPASCYTGLEGRESVRTMSARLTIPTTRPSRKIGTRFI